MMTMMMQYQLTAFAQFCKPIIARHRRAIAYLRYARLCVVQ